MKKLIGVVVILLLSITLLPACGGGGAGGPGGAAPPSGAPDSPGAEPGGEPSGGPSDWCDTGTYVTTPQGKAKVTGIEKHTINGKNVDLCCTEVEISGDGGKGKVKFKSCFSKDEDYTVVFQYDEATGKLYKFMETYPEGDKICTRMFDPTGKVMMESCQPRG